VFQTVVKYWSNSGQTVVKRRSPSASKPTAFDAFMKRQKNGLRQSENQAVKQWPNSGKKAVKQGSNSGQTAIEQESNRGETAVSKRRSNTSQAKI
jgi:hypothetical protein